MNTKNRLPDKLSDLLALALKDLTIISKNPKYEIDMGTWHNGQSSETATCSVCMAGAVLANTLKIHPTTFIVPRDFEMHGEPNVAKKMFIINCLRIGDLESVALGINDPIIFKDLMTVNQQLNYIYGSSIPEYHNENKVFSYYIKTLITLLKAQNL